MQVDSRLQELGTLQMGESSRREGKEEEEEEMPRWLKTLLDDTGFFAPCSNREHDKQGEKENILCIDCGLRLCPLCSPPHLSHRLLQIWRHMEHDTVQVELFSRLFDLTSVMAYAGNKKAVAFISTSRPKKRIRRSKQCGTCERTMNMDDRSIIRDLNCSPDEEEDVYCSIACKVKKSKEKGKLMKHLRQCASLLPLPVSCQRSERQPSLGRVLDTTTSMSVPTQNGAGGLAAAGESGQAGKKPRLGRASGDD